jgi:hypothetical protein
MRHYTVEFLDKGKPITRGNYKHMLVGVEVESKQQARVTVTKQYQEFCRSRGWPVDKPELKVRA